MTSAEARYINARWVSWMSAIVVCPKGMKLPLQVGKSWPQA